VHYLQVPEGVPAKNERYLRSETRLYGVLEIAKGIDGFWLGKSGEEDGQNRSLGAALAKRRDWIIAPIEIDGEAPPPARLKITFTGTDRKKGNWQLVNPDLKENQL
jgi:hypothetical protein